MLMARNALRGVAVEPPIYGRYPSAPDAVTTEDRKILDALERWRELRSSWEDGIDSNRQWFDGTKGQHYGRDVWSGKRPAWKPEWLCGRLMSTVRRGVPLIALANAKFFVRPVSDDLDDRQAASAGTRAALYLREQGRHEHLRAALCQKAFIDGGVYTKDVYDTATGISKRITVDAWEVFISPWALGPDQANVLFHETWPHIDAVGMQWAGNTKEQRAAQAKLRDVRPSTANIPSQVQRRLARVAGLDAGALGSDDLDGIVAYREYYERPTLDYKRGRYVVFVNETRIFAGDLPYIDAGVVFPFHYRPYIVIEGQAAGLSVVDVGRNGIATIEARVNQTLQHDALVCHGKWLVDERMDTTGKFVSRAGEIVKRNPNHMKPEFVAPPPMNPAHMLTTQFLEQEFDESVGLHDASRSMVPKRIESGKALAIAQEGDRSQSMTFYRAVDETERASLWNSILMEHTWGADDRLRQIIGRDREAEFIAFRKANLRETADLFCQSASSLVENPITKELQIYERLARGLMNLEDARAALDLPGVDGEFVSRRRQNQQRAQANIEALKRGEPVRVMELWDHATHMWEFEGFVLSRDFEELPDESKQLVVAHYYALQATAAQLARARAVIAGKIAPPGRGGSPQPSSGMGQNSPEVLRSAPQGDMEAMNGAGSERPIGEFAGGSTSDFGNPAAVGNALGG